ncbi:transposase DNA-binding-containing protein [Acidiferrobacter sp.]
MTAFRGSQDWANTKAAYRFLDNDRVNEGDILAGHFEATADRAASTDGPLLVLHDTTEFSYQRDDIEAPGHADQYCWYLPRRHTAIYHRLRHPDACEPRCDTGRIAAQVALIKFWSRKKFKGANALKKKIRSCAGADRGGESIRWLQSLEQSTARISDPARCVPIENRESGITKLFCKAQEAGSRFLLRTCVDQRPGDGSTTIAETGQKCLAKDDTGSRCEIVGGACRRRFSSLRYVRSISRPPSTKQRRTSALTLTVLHAVKRGKHRGHDPVVGKLITHLPIHSRT